MPTAKPRLQITLQPSTHATLKRLSTLNGEPMSRIVAEMIDLCAPTLGRVADTLEAAMRAPKQAREHILATVQRGEAQAHALLAELQQAVSDGGGAPATAAAADPLRSNTGVRFHHTNPPTKS